LFNAENAIEHVRSPSKTNGYGFGKLHNIGSSVCHGLTVLIDSNFTKKNCAGWSRLSACLKSPFLKVRLGKN
jgi:hypothetical protein